MNLKDLVQSLLFYVGIPAVTLYPLGFAALAIQLWNDPLFPYYDFDTVWYAVTLVPQTQVMGSALKLIFISLGATAVGVGIALRVSRSVRRRRGLSVEEMLEGRRRGRWAIYLLVLLSLAAFLLAYDILLDSWADVFALAAFLVLSVGVGVLVGVLRARLRGLVPHRAGRRLRRGGVGGLVLRRDKPADLAVGAHRLAVRCRPLLREDDDETFVVLAPGSSYWHVFNEEGLYAVDREQLKLVQYQHCPWYQIRGIEPGVHWDS
jgi:hypothetical protein